MVVLAEILSKHNPVEKNILENYYSRND